MDDFYKDYTDMILERGVQFVFLGFELTGHRNISQQEIFYNSIVEIVKRNQGRFDFEELSRKFMEEYLVIDNIKYAWQMVNLVSANEDIWGQPFITEGFRKDLSTSNQ